MTRVDQVLSSAAPYDATTGQARLYRRLLAEAGMEGEVYASEVDPAAADEVRPLAALADERRDLLLLHYTGFAPGMRALLERPEPLLLQYHNVTPARYFWNLNPYVATICQLGRDLLPRCAAAARVACAVSGYNAAELRRAGAAEVRVVPVLLDPGRLEPAEPPAGLPEGRPLVLVVGRMSPHKRYDLVLRVFALFQRRHAPEAALACVGTALDPPFRRRLEAIAVEAGARNVALLEGLPQPQLNKAYREADLLLSLSEHEGFCVPLLEAFHFGLPVVARPAGGMAEVGGDAVLWLDGDDVSVAAELMRLALGDDELRRELRRRGAARLRQYGFEQVAASLHDAVRDALDGGHSTPPPPRSSIVSREERSGPGTERRMR